jgi:hypothetical protein
MAFLPKDSLVFEDYTDIETAPKDKLLKVITNSDTGISFDWAVWDHGRECWVNPFWSRMKINPTHWKLPKTHEPVKPAQ